MRRLLALLAACLIAFPAVASPPAPRFQLAQFDGCQAGFCSPKVAAASTYTGIGDLQAKTAYWSTRAYKRSIVTAGTQALLNLRRTSDSHTCDIIVSASGGLGNTGNCSSGGDNGTALLSWATRSTFSGTISTTTLTTTGDPCTATAGDQITGTGITSYTKISTVTTCAAGSGSYVISQSFTISVAETITDLIPTFVPEIYDQTGNGWNVVQATAGDQPPLQAGNIGSFWGIAWPANSAVILIAGSNITPATGVASFGVVVNRSASGGGGFVRENGSGSNNRLTGNSGANQWATGGSTNIIATATDAVWHVGVSAVNTTGTFLQIDGVNTTGSAAGTTTAGAPEVGAGVAAFQWTESYFVDNVATSQSEATLECENEQAYFGASNFGATC